MTRAEYDPEDIGHFGLACRPYLHFTSPIRRYPDLWVHQVIKETLGGGNGSTEVDRERLTGLGRLTSDRERRAVDAERIYVRTKQMRYMERHIGERFSGMVSGVLRGGFFVGVADFMVDGFCFLRDLDDYFEFDEKRHRLVGRHSRRIFQLGTQVQVIVAGVDWVSREMDLVLVEEESPRKKGKKKKGMKSKKSKKGSAR
jgi:ribonuclease R